MWPRRPASVADAGLCVSPSLPSTIRPGSPRPVNRSKDDGADTPVQVVAHFGSDVEVRGAVRCPILGFELARATWQDAGEQAPRAETRLSS